MILEQLAAVILDLLIRLHGLLRGEKVRAGAEYIRARSQAEWVGADCKLNTWCGIENAGALYGILNSVFEFGIAEADAVGERTETEVYANHMDSRVIRVLIRLKGVGNERKHALILIVGKAVERPVSVSLIVHAPDRFGLPERRGDVPRETGKRTSREDWIDQILLGAFRVEEKEELVLDDGATKAATKLIPLEWILRATRQVCVETLVAEIVEALAMQGVGSRLGVDAHGPGRSQLSGEVERRLLQRVLLDRPHWNVLGCGADVLVADVNTVDLDACGPAEAAAEGHGRESVLRGIEGSAILNLDAGLQLGEIEEVTPVDG